MSGRSFSAIAVSFACAVALLEEKTKGNLTGQEERLIGSVLVDLRARLQELAADSAAKVST